MPLFISLCRRYDSFVEFSRSEKYPMEDGRLPGLSNQRVSCSDYQAIPRLNLNEWRDMIYTWSCTVGNKMFSIANKQNNILSFSNHFIVIFGRTIEKLTLPWTRETITHKHAHIHLQDVRWFMGHRTCGYHYGTIITMITKTSNFALAMTFLSSIKLDINYVFILFC